MKRSRPGGEGRPPRVVQLCLRKPCKRKRRARGLCAMHYARMRKQENRRGVRPTTVQILPSSADKWVRPGQDKACNGCGAPTVWGYCLICTPQMVDTDAGVRTGY